MVSRRKRFSRWWRRSGMGLRAVVLGVSLVLLALLVYWQRPTGELTEPRNALLVFVLFNLNIVVLSVLAFLIGRNVVKLVFDRKRRIIGSRLKLKLVAAFVGLTLIPTSFVFVLASGLLNQAMEGWFSQQIEGSVSGAVELGRLHFSMLREQSGATAQRLAQRIESGFIPQDSSERLQRSLEERRREEDLFSIRVRGADGTLKAAVVSPVAAVSDLAEPELSQGAIERALKGTVETLLEERGGSQFIRAYAPVRLRDGTGVVVIGRRVSDELLTARTKVLDSFTDYQQLKLFKGPLKTNYILTLAMLTGLLLFSAIWLGFYIARGLVGPLQRVAEGTRAVARGNYDVKIRADGDDEIAFLVESFNRMTNDLRLSREEAERRRLYLETILSSLGVAVITVSTEDEILSLNPSATRLFSIKTVSDAVGRSLREVLAPDVYRAIEELTLKAPHSACGDDVIEREVSFVTEGREHKVVCSRGTIRDLRGEVIGNALIFDDVTELSKMQVLSAWREVARRVAHEIKNPLTPIQLSAQRLERLAQGGPLEKTAQECAQTIVEHVDSIKRLANEFSRFSRMPTAEFSPLDLNELIAEVTSQYPERFPEIVFRVVADERVPRVVGDSEQIRRVFINLIDNAVHAVHAMMTAKEGNELGRITIRTVYDRSTKMVAIEVADTGAGIPEGHRTRIFEPYFTTKEEGSGLGLAIVSSIIAEHKGQIRVYPQQPHGTKFIVELPIHQSAVSARRLQGGDKMVLPQS